LVLVLVLACPVLVNITGGMGIESCPRAALQFDVAGPSVWNSFQLLCAGTDDCLRLVMHWLQLRFDYRFDCTSTAHEHYVTIIWRCKISLIIIIRFNV